jgi:hypothetical protein
MGVLCQQGVNAGMSKQANRLWGLGLTEGHKEGNDTRSTEAANQRRGRCDGVVGRGQPLGGRLTSGRERPEWFGWG